MSVTVAVTLITAVSTLSGAAISGYVAFLISRTQGNVQRSIAESQQLGQQLGERRQIRRDAYLKCLNQLGVAEQVVDNLWQSVAPEASAIESLVESAKVAVGELRQAADLVALEGPEAVSMAAQELGVRLTLEIADIIIAEQKAETGVVLCRVNEQRFIQVSNERARIKSVLINKARESLERYGGVVTAGPTASD